MPPYVEGRLEFDFTSALSVEKLDAPGAPLPHGMALVDFVVEEGTKRLLIEVKDPEGAPATHRNAAITKFLKKMKGDGLISEEIVPKARDSYTYLHLMGKDEKDFILVAVLGVGNPDVALLGDFKNRLLGRLRKEASTSWVRTYVKDCIVVTPQTWSSLFAGYPLSVTP